YAFSPQAILDARDTTCFTGIVADAPGEIFPGMEAIAPGALPAAAETCTTLRDPDDPFLLLFTGGSTGKPAVWSKTPRNLLSEAAYLCQSLAINGNDIFISTVPPQHIYGLLFSVLVPLIAACVVLPRVYTFPEEIIKAVKEHQATILISVPAHYRVLKSGGLKKYSLRRALSSAGVLNKEDADFFYRKTGLDIMEIYGSTETGGVAKRSRSADKETWRSFASVDWKISHERLQVRSDFLSPELPRDKEGFFITADRAEPAGEQSFILQGRMDAIVKVGGKRVDLAHIQHTLKQIPGVNDAVVVAMPAHSGRGTGIAALGAGSIDASRVRKQLSENIELYAVPRHIAIVDAIPLLSTGKYDHTLIEKLLQIKS
ncbi:MAG: AMP-binding protein, partial [Pseudomonadota bacterium]